MNRALSTCAVVLCLAAVGCETPSDPVAAPAKVTAEPKQAPTQKATTAPGQDKAPTTMPAAALKPLFLSPADGEVWNLFGDKIIRKVAGKDTNGSYAVIEQIVAPGGGPPPHKHKGEEELFMVEEGEFEIMFGGETKKGGPGTIAMLPRGIPHGFRNSGKVPGKVLIVISPARFEGFFVDLIALPEKDRGDIAKVTEIGKKYDLEFLPPPGGAPSGTPAAGAAPSGTAAAGAPMKK